MWTGNIRKIRKILTVREITYTYINKERLAKKGGGVVRFTMYNWIIVDCCAFLEKKRLFMRKITVKMCKKRQGIPTYGASGRKWVEKMS